MGEKDGRTRTVTWEDPTAGAEVAKEMSGSNTCRRFCGGSSPLPRWRSS